MLDIELQPSRGATDMSVKALMGSRPWQVGAEERYMPGNPEPEERAKTVRVLAYRIGAASSL